MYRMLRQPRPVAFSGWTTWEAPDPGFWVPRGYAVVNCDLRGCGTSEGVGSLFSDLEAEDYFDLIEWAAAQPWSTGRVGLNGVSYLALSQYKVASLGPPSLAAICPWEGFTDAYRDLAWPGGIREDGFMRLWKRSLRGQRLTSDIRSEQVARPLRDEWWRSLVPALDRIRTPMLVCASFSDHNLHSQGSFRAFEESGSERKWAYTHRGGKWTTYYSADALDVQLRFFEHCLKDAETGITEQAPIRLVVHDARDTPVEIRQEREWPLARTQWRELYLGADGRLSEGAPGDGAVRFSSRDGEARFAWTIAEPLELTGPSALRLSIALEGADDCNLFVALEKWRGGDYVPFEGSYGFGLDHVTTGWLKLSHRALEDASSRPFAPVHTHLRPEPLSTGELAKAEIALLPSATAFRPGDRLQLVVRGRWPWPHNPVTGQYPAAYEPSPEAQIILHLGGEPPARLLVPFIPA
jgi:putative CocE/NonD family hydrolase